MPRPLDLAADGGVFENEPAVRTDVVRSDEFEPDVIPVAQMRSTRVMWARKEREQDKPATREVHLYTGNDLLYPSWWLTHTPSSLSILRDIDTTDLELLAR